MIHHAVNVGRLLAYLNYGQYNNLVQNMLQQDWGNIQPYKWKSGLNVYAILSYRLLEAVASVSTHPPSLKLIYL